MQRKTIILGCALSIVLCFGLTLVFIDGSLLPPKPCRPISYPQGQTRKQFSVITADPMETVIDFYVTNLDVQPWPADTGQWKKVTLDSGILFYCMGVDINGLTTETGCIYLRENGQGTFIEAELFRSEGGNVPCPEK